MAAMSEEQLSEILINTTDELALRELFEGRIRQHRYWVDDRSTKTAALGDMVCRLTNRHAYDYIPYAIKLSLEQTEENSFVTGLALTRNLVLRSACIGVNKFFVDHEDQLKTKLSKLSNDKAEGLWQEIINSK